MSTFKRVLSAVGAILSCLFISASVNAQDPIERGFGTAEDDVAYAICKTNDGGYVLSGYTRGYSPTLSMYPFIVKFDSSGQHVWSTYIPTPRDFCSTGIVQDPSGNIVGCSRFMEFSITVSDSIHVFKLDPGGNLIWQNYIDGGDARQCRKLAVTPNGNILIGGSLRQSTSTLKTNAVITILDSSGQFITDKVYSSFGNNKFTNLVRTSDGNYVFCSRAVDSLNNDFVFLVKTNSAGDSLWTRNWFLTTHPTNHLSSVAAITELNNTDLIVGGSLGNASFNKSFFLHLNSTATANMNIFPLGLTGQISDEINDLAVHTSSNRAYGSNWTYNFGSRFQMASYNPNTHIVSPYYRFFNVGVSTFDVDYHMREANAIIDDSKNGFDVIEVLAGSTKLSGYGKEDFALARSYNLGSSINDDPPIISLHGRNFICQGDSVLITLDSLGRDFHHWANISDVVLGDTADFDLGIAGDSLWVSEDGYYMCIAFDADSNLFSSNVIRIQIGIDTIKISNTLPLAFCAAAGQPDSTVLYVSNMPAWVGPVTYQWYRGGATPTLLTGETDSFYVAKTGGSYYCQGSTSCGNYITNSLVVRPNARPSQLYTYVNNINLLSGCTAQSFGWLGGDSLSTYTWYDSTGSLLPWTGPMYSPGYPTNMYGVAVNACGKDSVLLRSTLVTALFPAPVSYLSCATGARFLRVSYNYKNASNYTWYHNGNLISGAIYDTLTVFQPGTYVAQFVDSVCPGVFNTLSSTVNPAPVLTPFNIQATDSLLCPNDPGIALIVPSYPYITYSWYKDGSNTYFNNPQSPVVTSGGTYMLVLDDGCTMVFDSIVIVQDSLNVTASASGPVMFCQGDSVALSTQPGNLTSWQWKNRSYAIPSATQSVYYAKNSGRFYCIVSDSLGCTDTSNTIVVSVPCLPLDPNELKTQPVLTESPFSVYPNPSHDRVNIIAPPGQVSVIDVMGRTIIEAYLPEGKAELDLTGLNPGIYLVRSIVQGDVRQVKLYVY